MIFNIHRYLILILIIALINTNCKKNESLTPTEILIGKWQLVSIQGSDTSTNIKNRITRIVTLSYNNNPLIITFDSITSQRVATYNLLYQLEFKDDGHLLITEEYSTPDNISIYSMHRTDSWFKDLSKINPYSYYLYTTSDYSPISATNSKIFLHFMHAIHFDEKNFTKHQLTLQDVDKDNGQWNFIYTFKKL